MRGENHPMHKLTEQQAAEIKERTGRGESGPKLAVEFGVGNSTIYRIKNGRNWK